MRLIDADKLKDIISDTWILDRIDEQPTVDAAEVVRCKDCKHYLADPWGFGNCSHDYDYKRTSEHGFCAWGERREDETD